MKQILVVLAVFFGTQAYAGDFNHTETNYSIQTGDFKIGLRQDLGTSKDFVQLTYKGIKNVDVDYRYTDDTTIEHRARFTYKKLTAGGAYFKPRLEYRYFEGGAKDDYFRIVPIVGYEHQINQVRIYTELEPRFNVGKSGEKNDSKVDSSEFRVGFNYKVNDNVSFGPFVQTNFNKDWNKTDRFLGTEFSVKF